MHIQSILTLFNWFICCTLRLQAYNNGNSQLEVFCLADKHVYDYYSGAYPNNWYDQLVADVQDLWNDVSYHFSSPKVCTCRTTSCATGSSNRPCTTKAFSNQLNGISVKMIMFDVFTGYNGIYSQLNPGASSGNIVASTYQQNLRGFVTSQYANRNFDQTTMLTWQMGNNVGGIGSRGTICSGRQVATTIVASASSTGQKWAKVTAHELGHNFDVKFAPYSLMPLRSVIYTQMGHDVGPTNTNPKHSECNQDDGICRYIAATFNVHFCSLSLNRHYGLWQWHGWMESMLIRLPQFNVL